VTGKTVKTIGPGGEKFEPAIPATGSHYLTIFQMSDKIIGLCNGGKADRPEFFKSIIRFFFHSHFLPPQYGNASVQTDSSDVMHQADLRPADLNFTGLISELKHNRSDL
jgi:hypothetical protein